MMAGNEATQGKRKSLELSALPKLVVPAPTENNSITSSGSHLSAQPHALSVDFQCVKGEAISPCSDISLSSRCSVVSLSPSLFPLPPTAASPPTTSHSTTFDSPPTTARSQTSISSWFSPPSPPPSSPLPPTPVQKRLASLIAATNGLESLQVPPTAVVKTPLSAIPDVSLTCSPEPPSTPPRRPTNYNVDTQGIRESIIDPDAPLSPPPRSSLPPPYSPGYCTPQRYSNTSVPSTRVDSTTPLTYQPPVEIEDATPQGTPAAERGRTKSGDAEEGGIAARIRQWRTGPKGRRRKMMVAAVGAATVALLMVIAGVAVGIYIAVSGAHTI
ncbi:uncharacterized protein F4822DRAFT_390717 [Hypoxylon trugodes]|uniref:uncharacterized protein n=1 Tax=Hypoxylon trugodes TaxID=326681 RepID=UPI0021A1AAB6|nr:uncharacterized protein F4822DRAFT_390717 [Hypoxylon trugodes]KAI1392351.1 hypothetical protein F4822DRAFT_390717 [Hypoxylon trugodes]